MEGYYGHSRFLLLYIIGAFCGNTLSFVLSPSASLGASTAIFALVAAEGVFIYRNRSMFGTRARSMLSNLVLIVVVNLVIGLQPGIDNWGTWEDWRAEFFSPGLPDLFFKSKPHTADTS